jgi:hypothetical protein
MPAVIDLLSPRSFARAFALLGVGLVAANCSPDVERFNDNPFGTNMPRSPSETTGSVPRGQVQTRPLTELQPAGQPLPAVFSRALPTQPRKRGSKLPSGEKSTLASPTTLPAQAARRPVTWLPAPPEGTHSAPPDFLTGGEK